MNKMNMLQANKKVNFKGPQFLKHAIKYLQSNCNSCDKIIYQNQTFPWFYILSKLTVMHNLTLQCTTY